MVYSYATGNTQMSKKEKNSLKTHICQYIPAVSGQLVTALKRAVMKRDMVWKYVIVGWTDRCPRILRVRLNQLFSSLGSDQYLYSSKATGKVNIHWDTDESFWKHSNFLSSHCKNPNISNIYVVYVIYIC